MTTIAATRVGTTRDTNHRGQPVKACARCGRERQVDKRRQVADMCRRLPTVRPELLQGGGMTRATDALNAALAHLAASTCTEPGCNRLAPDPDKACDYHLRIHAPYLLKAAWRDPDQYLDPQGGGTE